MPGVIPAESLLAFAAGPTCPSQMQAIQRDADHHVGGGPLAALPTREGLQTWTMNNEP